MKKVLDEHKKWLDGTGGECANLRGADLQSANLHDADLRSANLQDADLQDADLRSANLQDADLRGADLRDADLRGADLRDADLRGADLQDADLQDADLRSANLRGADLRDANLQDVNLRGADLRDANLRDAKNVPPLPQTVIVPEEGSFIGWKRVGNTFLVKLRICEDAKRSCATGRKCRCSAAEVLEITRIDTGVPVEWVRNEGYKPFVVYEVGKVVTPDWFDEDRWNECSHGIHFFLTKQEAIEY